MKYFTFIEIADQNLNCDFVCSVLEMHFQNKNYTACYSFNSFFFQKKGKRTTLKLLSWKIVTFLPRFGLACSWGIWSFKKNRNRCRPFLRLIKFVFRALTKHNKDPILSKLDDKMIHAPIKQSIIWH